MVISTTESVFSVLVEIAVKPRSCVIHWTSGSEKFSAAKALPKNPARVIPIWIVDKNPDGSSTILSMRPAFLSPSSIIFRSFPGFREMTAISVAAKKAFSAIKTTCKSIWGPIVSKKIPPNKIKK